MTTQALTAASFEQTLLDNDIVLVDWWAAWCGPCRAFGPTFEKASAAHPDIVFGKVDTEAEQSLAGSAGITSIPTLMVFRANILVYSKPGAMPGPGPDRRHPEDDWAGPRLQGHRDPAGCGQPRNGPSWLRAHRDQPQTVPVRAWRRRLSGRSVPGEALPVSGLSLTSDSPRLVSGTTRRRRNSTATLSGIVRHTAVVNAPGGICQINSHNGGERDHLPGVRHGCQLSRSSQNPLLPAGCKADGQGREPVRGSSGLYGRPSLSAHPTASKPAGNQSSAEGASDSMRPCASRSHGGGGEGGPGGGGGGGGGGGKREGRRRFRGARARST